MKVNKNYQEFHHPRLTSIYDIVNSVDGYLDFYKEFALSIEAKNIVDFGCGTWLLTSELLEGVDSIIGIDPSEWLIEKAKEKYWATKIEWKVTDNFDAIDAESMDLVVLSGHVVQFLIDNTLWEYFLRWASRILRKGGYIIFESRNPDIEPFGNWPTKDSTKVYKNSPEWVFSWWWEWWIWNGNILSYSLFYHFYIHEVTIESPMSLIFRTKKDILHDTWKYWFRLVNLYWNWKKSSYTKSSEEMIFLFQKQ